MSSFSQLFKEATLERNFIGDYEIMADIVEIRKQKKGEIERMMKESKEISSYNPSIKKALLKDLVETNNNSFPVPAKPH